MLWLWCGGDNTVWLWCRLCSVSAVVIVQCERGVGCVVWVRCGRCGVDVVGIL